MKEKIQDAIEEIRNILQKGISSNLELIEITGDYKVKIKLTGECADYPMSLSTMIYEGVESMLRKRIPEVRDVIFIQETPAGFCFLPKDGNVINNKNA